MNTVCLIGDSHAAGIYRAALADSVDNLDIYARGGQDLKQLVCIENTLSICDPDTHLFSNTQYKNVDLKKYKHIIIYGCQILSGANGKEWIENYRDFTSNRYSSDCIKAIQIDCLNRTNALSVIDVIRGSDFKGSITVIPAPLPSVNHPMIRNISVIAKHDFLEDVENTYSEHFKKMNIGYRSLPRELLADNKYTVSEKYQFASKSGKDDTSHLNDIGCAIVLGEILKLVKELTGDTYSVPGHV